MFNNLKVIELASVLAGPSVGMFFAELGAEVIKVESPMGDVTRSWKSKTENPNNSISAYYSSVNWGKEQMILNLREEAEREKLYALIKTADIVISSFKGKDAEKLGVDYETLKTIQPKIIVGKITGYGSDNPRVGYDAVIQAESGFMFMNGQRQSPPTKMPVALMDLLTAHQLKEGILCALIHLLKTGKGSLVEASLIHSGICSLANQATNYLVNNAIPQAIGSEHPNICPYGTVFKTKDHQYVILAVGNDKQFQNLCSILNLESIATHQEYRTNEQRVKNKESLIPQLEEAIQKNACSTFIESCIANNVPAGIVNNMEQVFETKEGNEMLLQGENLKGLRTIAFKAPFYKPEKLTAPKEL